MEDEIEPLTINDNANEAVNDEILREHEQSVLQDLESFFGAMKRWENDINIILQEFLSNFVTWDTSTYIQN